MIDLNDRLQRTKIVLQMYADVDEACRKEFAEGNRKHLGASIIGEDCQAKGWNTFRWLKKDKPSGQQYRLFNRGHEEERRFIRWLNLIGFEVLDVNPETQKQFRITGSKGHFGGSLDSLMKPPERYGIGPMVWLGEFKTHGETSYASLAGPKPKFASRGQPRTGGKGVFVSKPIHYKQMCSYGRAWGLEFGLYCAVNKDTDELYFEIVKLDYNLADDLFRKADAIIFSQEQSPKIALSAAYTDCKFCVFSGICHNGEAPEVNCRSCRMARPVDDGKWWCDLYSNNNGPIPDGTIEVGCASWARIV